MAVRLPFIPAGDALARFQIQLSPGWQMKARDGRFDLSSGAHAEAPFDSKRRMAWCAEPPFDREIRDAYAYALRELNAVCVSFTAENLARPLGGVLFLAAAPTDAVLPDRIATIDIPIAAPGDIALAHERFTWRGHDAFLWILWCTDCRSRHLADELCPFCVDAML